MQDNKKAVIVHPCSRLAGEIKLQGSKNSVLPIMAVVSPGLAVKEISLSASSFAPS